MSGKTLTPGKHALLNLGDGNMTQLILSDVNGNNIEAYSNAESGVEDVIADVISVPYPNPFIETLNIPYNANIGSNVEILIHDVTGRLIYSAKTRPAISGENLYKWTPQGLSRGVYFVTVIIDGNALCGSAKVIYEK